MQSGIIKTRRLILHKAVDQRGIPFPINASKQGVRGISADEISGAFNNAVKQDIAKKRL